MAVAAKLAELQEERNELANFAGNFWGGFGGGGKTPCFLLQVVSSKFQDFFMIDTAVHSGNLT